MPRKTKYNKITTPEKLAQVNPENIQLKDDFANYLSSIQRAPQTISQYMYDLNIFFVWNLEHNNNKSFVDVTKRNIVAFQRWVIDENKNSPGRVCRIKSTLSSLSNFIESILDDEYKDFRPIIRKVESPTNQKVREKTVLEDEQVQFLLDYFTEREQYDKACVFALAAMSGRRKSELPRFKVSYFDDCNKVCGGCLYKTPEKIKTKGHKGTGSTGKMISVYTLADEFKPYFDRWMNYREEHGIESEWLFPSKANPDEPISISTLDSYAHTASRILGDDFYFHALRHYFTTRLSKLGVPDSAIQMLIGWSDISMVGVYKDIDADDELSKYFTSDGIAGAKSVSIGDLL